VDHEGVYIYTNSKVKDILGYEAEEIIGKKAFDLILPNERESLSQWFMGMLQSPAPFVGILNTNLHKNGRMVLLETSGVPVFDAKGNLSGFRGIDRDITDRKRVEDTLRKRTEALAERVKELNCLYGVSDLVAKSGISLDAMLRGVVDLIPSSWRYPEIACARIKLSDREIKSENFHDSSWKQSSDIVVYGKGLGVLEVCYLEERPVLDEGPFLTEERLLINAVAVRLGKTIERRQAEGALKRAHDHLEKRIEERTIELKRTNGQLNHEIEHRRQTELELQETTEKIKLFAYSVSHDLKSPAIGLHGLMRRFSRLYAHVLDQRGKAYCEQALSASAQIVALVEDINSFISSKEAPITVEPVNLKALFLMVKEEISPQLNSRNIRWVQPDDLPEIRADQLAIVRVIRNLVDNALKYGGQTLTEISIGYEADAKHHILTVRDNGIGLEEADSKDIFEIFRRTKTSRGTLGTGLGLAIAKEIAERHGGRIWMKPGKKKGIAFSISISKYLERS